MLTPECDPSPASLPQCPTAVGRRSLEVKKVSEEFFQPGSERVEWRVQVPTSGSKMSSRPTAFVYKESGHVPCMAVLLSEDHDEQKDGYDDNSDRNTVCAKVEAPQKDKVAAVAQTQMPGAQPKAKRAVPSTQLTDGYEAACLRERYGRPLLMLKGSAALANTDPSKMSSVHPFITGKASASTAQQETTVRVPRVNRKPSHIIREETKRQYYQDLCQQVEEKKQKTERERSRNTTAEKIHNETMQHCIWGSPGSGAPNYHLGTVRRTKLLSTAGILPQEQVRYKGFSGTPFHCM